MRTIDKMPKDTRTKDKRGLIIKIDATTQTIETLEKRKVFSFIPAIRHVEYNPQNPEGVVLSGEYVWGSEVYSGLNELIFGEAA